MIKSMTGFGRSISENDDMLLEVEIKTVNNRYTDWQIRMPSYLNFAEDKIKKTIQEKISRGRIEVFIKVTPKSQLKSEIIVDKNLAVKMYEALNEISNLCHIDKVTLPDILKNEEIIIYKKKDMDEKKTISFLEESVSRATEKVCDMRTIEGENLKEDLLKNLNDLSENVLKFEKITPLIVEENYRRLESNMQKVLKNKIPIDQDRLANELAIFADRLDVNEEITRLKSHIDQFRTTMDLEIPVGKKLDFIIQEMNREVNTTSSKANDTELINLAIESKSLIEKLREQIQNVE